MMTLDVIGSPLDVIASGPTVSDLSTFQVVGDIFTRYGLWDQAPASICRIFKQGLVGQIWIHRKLGQVVFGM